MAEKDRTNDQPSPYHPAATPKSIAVPPSAVDKRGAANPYDLNSAPSGTKTLNTATKPKS